MRVDYSGPVYDRLDITIITLQFIMGSKRSGIRVLSCLYRDIDTAYALWYHTLTLSVCVYGMCVMYIVLRFSTKLCTYYKYVLCNILIEK